MDSTLRALNGFGMGARPGERRRVSDPRGWLKEQVQGPPPTLQAPLAASPQTIADAVHGFRNLGQMTEEERRQARQQARRRLIEIAGSEGRAALSARTTAARPFVERLVAFWSNHLCISAGAKVLVAPLAGSYEREAIRPHVLGRFEDMVMASAKHPAMLVYLDNFQSIGPNSRGARAGARGRVERGLNENYARELLELHTLGVDGGYDQQDVQELAKVLTGWTVGGLVRGGGLPAMRRGRGARQTPVDPSDDRVRFVFQDLLHEPGAKTVVGVKYNEAGLEEGERAIRALARHPSTARFVATKLVTHFVSDEPPAPAVDRVAKVFRETEGDLRAVSTALVDLPEAWGERARKFRTPQDWLIAVLRAFDAPEASETMMPVLRQLRHPLWSPQAPKGFGDKTQDWADPDALLNRAELSRTLARRMRARQFDPRILAEVVDVPSADPLHTVLADKAIAVDERIALALAGPAFQWR